MNRPSPVQPVDGRSVVSTGVGITPVVAGAIFGLCAATFAHVLNAHVAGVLVVLSPAFLCCCGLVFPLQPLAASPPAESGRAVVS